MSATVGLISGSGTYGLRGLERSELHAVDTRFGFAEVTAGRLAGVDVLHVSRHGDGHVRLSHQVNHRANVAALLELGADCAVGLTICGAVDPALQLGDAIVFDDLYFPSNRLPEGGACTMFEEIGDPARAHWIFEHPFSEQLRLSLHQAAAVVLENAHANGCYGHVDGPRFNTKAEVRALSSLGVTAISQTVGVEAVLAGESQLPYAAVGYVTDWANGAGPQSTPVPELLANMVSSVDAFDRILRLALPAIATGEYEPVGVVHGFERDRQLFRGPASNGNASLRAERNPQ